MVLLAAGQGRRAARCTRCSRPRAEQGPSLYTRRLPGEVRELSKRTAVPTRRARSLSKLTMDLAAGTEARRLELDAAARAAARGDLAAFELLHRATLARV